MKVLLTIIMINTLQICYSQKTDTTSPISSYKYICQSSNQIEIALTRSGTMTGGYETVHLTFNGHHWTAKKLNGNMSFKKVVTTIIKPKINYDTVIACLTRNNVFNLDNQDNLVLKGSVDDGINYTLTYKVADTCRTYYFNNPEYYKEWNKNVQALDNYINIIRILFDDFTSTALISRLIPKSTIPDPFTPWFVSHEPFTFNSGT